MAKQSHQKGSRGTSRRGFVGGLMQFFDLQPLLHIKRTIWGRRHRRGGGVSGHNYVRMKGTFASAGNEEGYADDELEPTMGNEIKSVDKMDNGVSSELVCLSSPKPRLTRTYSIHYLECNDYVGNKNENVPNLQSDASRSILEGSNSLEKLKTTQVNDRKEDFAAKQAEDLFGAMDLYNKSKEIFLKILHDQDPVSVKSSHEDSIKIMSLTKCSSFPRPDLLRSRKAFSTLKLNKDDNRPFLKRKVKSQVLKEESSGMFSSNFNDFKTQMIDEMNKEHEKEKHRISMDGILHKVPYGQKFSGGIAVEKPSASDWHVTHRRSRSLAESVERYSHFIDHTFSRESNIHVLQRSRSARDNVRSFPAMNRSKTLGSINSFNEFMPQFGKGDMFEDQRPITLLITPTFDSSEPSSASNMSVPDEKWKTSVRENSGLNVDVLNQSLEHHIEDPACTTDVAEKESMEVTESHIFEESNFSGEILPENTECMSWNEKEMGLKDDSDDRGVNFSPVSEHDLENQENLDGLKKFPVSEDPNFKPESTSCLPHSEDESTENILFPKSSSFDSIRILIDGKDEAEFNYVREILTKSGFIVNEVSSGWNSPDQPVGFSVFEELEGSKCRMDVGLYVPDINLDHLLLFDLINEVLLETYSSHLSPWLSSLSFQGRQLTVGSRVLEEVWAKINWHRRHKSQQSPPPDLKLTVSHEDLRYEAESMGQELEDDLLDDLLDEVILQLYDP